MEAVTLSCRIRSYFAPTFQFGYFGKKSKIYFGVVNPGTCDDITPTSET